MNRRVMVGNIIERWFFTSQPKLTAIVNFFRRYFWPIILLLYSLLPLTQFKEDYLYRPEEVSYLNYGYTLDHFLSAWSDRFNQGGPSGFFTTLAIFPMGIFYRILTDLHLPLFLVQRLFYFLVFSLTVFSLFRLLVYLFREKFLALIGVIFYTTSFYSMTTPFYTAKMLQLFFLPLTFYPFLRFLRGGEVKYILWNAFVWLIFPSIFMNLPTALVTLSVYPIVLIFAREKIPLKSLIFFFLPLVPVFAFVLFLYLNYLGDGVPTIDNSGGLYIWSKFSQVLKLLHGAWWEEQPVYNPWLKFYQSPPISWVSYFLFALSLVSLFRRWGGQAISLVLFLILFLFLSSGTGSPFGSFYTWFYYETPIGFIFREPWAKFAPPALFLLTLCLVLSLASFPNFKKLWLATFLCVLFLGYPSFRKALFRHDVIGRGGINVRLPDYWRSAQKYFEDQKDLNVLVLPVHGNPQKQPYHLWYADGVGNFSGGLTDFFLPFNTLSNTSSIHPKTTITELLGVYNPLLVSALRPDYVLNQGDVEDGSLDTTINLDELRKDGFISESPSPSFGPLDFYRVAGSRIPPLIFSTRRPISFLGDLKDLNKFSSLLRLKDSDVIITEESSLSDRIEIDARHLRYHPRLIGEVPNLEEIKKDRVLGKIEKLIRQGDLSDARKLVRKSLLIFAENDNYWLLATKLADGNSFSQWLSDHVSYDCFANCFKVNLPRTGTYEIFAGVDSPRAITDLKLKQGEKELGRGSFLPGQNLVALGRLDVQDQRNFVLSLKSEALGKRLENLRFNQKDLKEGKVINVSEVAASAVFYVDYPKEETAFRLNLIGQEEATANEAVLFSSPIEGYLTRDGRHFEAKISLPPKFSKIIVEAKTLKEGASLPSSIRFSLIPVLKPRLHFLLRDPSPPSAEEAPLITFSKRGTTRYELNVTGAKSPFLLVFLKSFSRNWQARLGDEKVVSEADHHKAFWYANAWLIRPADFSLGENFRVVVEYKNQKYFVGLLLLLAATLLAVVAALCFSLRQKKKVDSPKLGGEARSAPDRRGR